MTLEQLNVVRQSQIKVVKVYSYITIVNITLIIGGG
jgi:hypothetical protein